MGPVIGDRNKNRAHAYEGRKSGTAKMLTFFELRDAIAFAESLLDDLLRVASGKQTIFGNMLLASGKHVTDGLVDMVLLGNGEQIDSLRSGLGRDRLYDELHRLHDDMPSDARPFFNGMEVRLALIDAHGTET